MSGVITSTFQLLPVETGPGSTSAEDEPVNEAEDEEEDTLYGDEDSESPPRPTDKHNLIKTSRVMEGKRVGGRRTLHQAYTLGFNANLTSTVVEWEDVRISMHHTQHGPLHLKTDIDIQVLPSHLMMTLLSFILFFPVFFSPTREGDWGGDFCMKVSGMMMQSFPFFVGLRIDRDRDG